MKNKIQLIYRQSWAVIIQVHGHFFCISSKGIPSTEYLKYFKKLCIPSTSSTFFLVF